MEKLGAIKKCKYRDLTYTIGTVNKTKPTCIYINFGGWMTTDNGVEIAVDKISRRLRAQNPSLVRECFKDTVTKYLTDFDFVKAKASTKANQTSYFSTEVTLFGILNWNDKELQIALQKYSQTIYDLILSCDGLIMSPTRKG